MFETSPTGRYGPECAGHNLDVYSSREKQRNHRFDFAVSNERITAYQRQVEWFKAIDNVEHTIDERLPLAIVEAPQRNSTTQVAVLIGITARASERTLFRYFDGQGGRSTFEDLAPGPDDF
jgi:hypothetical protein